MLPPKEQVGDGEWVLAIFEVGGQRGRATAAAARGLDRGGELVLAFERRDWERLLEFTEPKGSQQIRAAAYAPPDEDDDAIPVVVASEPPPPGDVPREAVSSRPASTPRSVTPRAGAKSGARVLLIDDDRDIREVVGAMLDAVGLTVETASSAEEALERIRSDAYDMVVLDWSLPGMTGIELCRVIRREPPLMGLPVLFLTAHASSKDIVEAFASGADDYVVKPFRAPELGARIFGLLRRVRMVQPSP